MIAKEAQALGTRVGSIAALAIALVAAAATLAHPPTPADASPPAALELADHALTSPALLADESPYELIDPVGPGGITQSQALGEVTSSTMIGGVYNDNGHYGGGYGQLYLISAQPVRGELHAYGAKLDYRAPSASGGYAR